MRGPRQPQTALLQELRRLKISASQSLAERLEETLTLHRLGFFRQLGRSADLTGKIKESV